VLFSVERHSKRVLILNMVLDTHMDCAIEDDGSIVLVIDE